ncbi:MAG TPA: hypothetical protein VGE07_07735 [Herpetosiphonaceae bacterium]
MPVLINLTTADHGGRVSTGKCGTAECGVSCNCGCPYTAMEANGRTEPISAIEARHPGQWLGLVIPPEEDEFRPERAMLVVHSADDNEVWDAMNRVTHNQVIHVYFNGAYDDEYERWAASEPALPGTRSGLQSPFGGEMIALLS